MNMEKIVAALLILNVCLSALKAALNVLCKTYPSLAKADNILGMFAQGLQKLVDFASANVQHKEAAQSTAPVKTV